MCVVCVFLFVFFFLLGGGGKKNGSSFFFVHTQTPDVTKKRIQKYTTCERKRGGVPKNLSCVFFSSSKRRGVQKSCALIIISEAKSEEEEEEEYSLSVEEEEDKEDKDKDDVSPL